mmetsp:Transcript_94119/g.261441  ORF Transcript_94119/g.261441 Transcript_94119/m.261441 type:complete len:213 (-) Transcript_94119:9-647(-)
MGGARVRPGTRGVAPRQGGLPVVLPLGAAGRPPLRRRDGAPQGAADVDLGPRALGHLEHAGRQGAPGAGLDQPPRLRRAAGGRRGQLPDLRLVAHPEADGPPRGAAAAPGRGHVLRAARAPRRLRPQRLLGEFRQPFVVCQQRLRVAGARHPVRRERGGGVAGAERGEDSRWSERQAEGATRGAASRPGSDRARLARRGRRGSARRHPGAPR